MVVDTFVNMTQINIHESMVCMSKWWLPWLLGQLSPYWGNCACLGQNVFEVNRETGLDSSTITAPSLVNKTCNKLQDVLTCFSGNQISLSYGECIEIVMFSSRLQNYDHHSSKHHASCNYYASYHNLFCLWFGILVAMKTLH